MVEERDPHVDYDREHIVILDDYLSGTPKTAVKAILGLAGLLLVAQGTRVALYMNGFLA